MYFFVGEALKDLPNEQFDVVILSNILEHLPDRKTFLKCLFLQIRPRRILIRVPMFDRHWSVPLRKELGVNWMGDSSHYTLYTKESFIEEIEAAELNIVEMEICWGEIWAEVRPR